MTKYSKLCELVVACTLIYVLAWFAGVVLLATMQQPEYKPLPCRGVMGNIVPEAHCND